jgi:hypothetical protein
MTKIKLIAGGIASATLYVVCLVAAIGIWISCIAANPLLGVFLGWLPGFLIFCVWGVIEENAALKSERRYRDELMRARYTQPVSRG